MTPTPADNLIVRLTDPNNCSQLSTLFPEICPIIPPIFILAGLRMAAVDGKDPPNADCCMTQLFKKIPIAGLYKQLDKEFLLYRD